jgi:putative DNA methylase
MASVQKRKLIEVGIPLEAINKASAKEKSIRQGHPSTLHLWWARRPLAAARAVLFAQLVDDPSAHPDQFPPGQAERTERERLHNIIKELVVWDNPRADEFLAMAREEILKSTNGNPPPILDPFSGGGTIPLEAQRFGLEAYASDLNPVAVLINKALIEIPPKFRDRAPVFPGETDALPTQGYKQTRRWRGAEGIATDVRAYGAWIRDEAQKRIGQFYPKADGKTVIAWIWARTVTCPNPACGIEMPLVRSWWLGKRKGKEAYLVPTIVANDSHPSGHRVKFDIRNDASGPTNEGTMSGRRGATCVACRAVVGKDYIKSEGASGRMGATLMAVVAEGMRQRIYLAPTDEHESAADVERPTDVPNQELGYDPRNLWTPQYGLTKFSDLFTDRQLLALTTFSDLVGEARELVLKDGIEAGMPEGDRLEVGGTGAHAYADAVATYLALAVSAITDDMSSLVSWSPSHGTGATRSTFARQALPMVWDYAEVNPFSHSTGDFANTVPAIASVLERNMTTGHGHAEQANAIAAVSRSAVISTDPPYYDNVGYSDLSDFFYVWLRRTIRQEYPDLLNTVLVPKAEELVANPYRFGGRDEARTTFESGFREVFGRARTSTIDSYPITVYYAFKQSESDPDGDVSAGWETLLDGMIRSGWTITATWPMRSERAGRMLAIGTNALASSIVLSLRPRPENAPTVDRRGFISALHAGLPDALRKLQQGLIAPVDLPQAAIGPGMAVFSRYASVIEDDGSRMSVRSALARINEILDQVLNEQEGDFDTTTRFAIAWYRQHGYGIGRFGDADNLARARNTAVETLARDGVLTSRANKVALIKPVDLDTGYDIAADKYVGIWETLHNLIRVLESDGVDAAGALLAKAGSRPIIPVDGDLVMELSFLLFSIAEKNGWTKDALAFNALATSWADIVDASRGTRSEQLRLDYDSEG